MGERGQGGGSSWRLADWDLDCLIALVSRRVCLSK